MSKVIFKISGTISNEGHPICTAYIGNKAIDAHTPVRTVIDTGAYGYHLKSSIIKQLELPKVGEGDTIHPEKGKVLSGIYLAEMFIGEMQMQIMVKEFPVETYYWDFLIGTYFLAGQTFIFNGKSNMWTIDWQATS